MKQDILGVDIGGVLIDKVADGTDTSFFSDRFIETPQVEGAFETLARLGRERFGDNIYVVSKCGPRIEAKSKLWLAHHRFHDITGVTPARLNFCRARRDKAPICARLQITHFIDDRLDVLAYLTMVPHQFLFDPRAGAAPPRVTIVRGWGEVARELL